MRALPLVRTKPVSPSDIPPFRSRDSAKIWVAFTFANLLLAATIFTPPAMAQRFVNAEPTEDNSEGLRCYIINSRIGWQYMPLIRGFENEVSINMSDTWSVDAANYERVGIFGHTGADAERLGPYSEYKFSPAFDFGYLLVSDTNGNFYSSVVNEFKLNPSIQGLYLRINDSDETLHDNVGFIRVCTQQVLW
jgi:hypothetical protein